MLINTDNPSELVLAQIRNIFFGVPALSKMDIESLDCSINNSIELKNESHPPIEYYKDQINVNIINNNNININVNAQPPKKPWNKILDIILTIVKLITLIASIYSLGDSDDDSSDNNLRLQLA